MEKQKCIIYLGDFDLRNENVQAHLVKNNAKVFNHLGYIVAFIGVNRKSSYEEILKLPRISVGDNNYYLEVENTLSFTGILRYRRAAEQILCFMDSVAKKCDVKYVISYQAPTFSIILKSVVHWCVTNNAKYIVNCADITSFKSQPVLRRIVMNANWRYLHTLNKRHANGVIAVSSYIEGFYHRDGIPSVIVPPLFDNYLDNSFELADKVTYIYAGSPFVLKKNVNTVGMKDRLDKIVDLFVQLSSSNISYRLRIIGITKEDYTSCVPRHKKELETNKDIIFEGRHSHQATLNAIRDADYMINIRDVNIMNEAGLSTKMVESVSLGTPVVMNLVGDNYLYLHEGSTGYMLSGDTLKDCELLRSLCDKTYQERLNIKMKCAGDKTFAIEKYEHKLKKFLEAVATVGE